MKAPRYPYSQNDVVLVPACRACGFGYGLLIVRFENDRGFVRCGACDAALFAVEEVAP